MHDFNARGVKACALFFKKSGCSAFLESTSDSSCFWEKCVFPSKKHGIVCAFGLKTFDFRTGVVWSVRATTYKPTILIFYALGIHFSPQIQRLNNNKRNLYTV
jgi:hypothetical protein